MINIRSLAGVAVAAAFLLQGCYVAPPPAPQPRPMSERFEQSWQAAKGAASDLDVRVTSEDRGSGTLRGTAGPSNVVITVVPQADQTIQVGFSVTGGTSAQESSLQQGLTNAYRKRMGR